MEAEKSLRLKGKRIAIIDTLFLGKNMRDHMENFGIIGVPVDNTTRCLKDINLNHEEFLRGERIDGVIIHVVTDSSLCALKLLSDKIPTVVLRRAEGGSFSPQEKEVYQELDELNFPSVEKSGDASVFTDKALGLLEIEFKRKEVSLR